MTDNTPAEELELPATAIMTNRYGAVTLPLDIFERSLLMDYGTRQLLAEKYAETVVLETLAAAAYKGTDSVDWDNPPTVNWLVEGVLPVDSSVMLLGRSGVGKSFLTVDLVAAIATGTSFAQTIPCVESRVLVYLSEGAAGYVDRFRAVVEANGLDFDSVKANVQIRSGANLASMQFQAELAEVCGSFQPDLVVFDTFSGTSGLPDENNAAANAGVLSHTKQSIGRASMLIVHHPNKSSQNGDSLDARGSGVFYNNLDLVLVAYEDKSFQGYAGRYLTLTTDPENGGKVKESAPVTIRGLYLDPQRGSLVVRRDTGAQVSRADAAVQKVLSDEPMSASAFAKAAGVSSATAFRYLKESVFARKENKGWVLVDETFIDEDEILDDEKGEGDE